MTFIGKNEYQTNPEIAKLIKILNEVNIKHKRDLSGLEILKGIGNPDIFKRYKNSALNRKNRKLAGQIANNKTAKKWIFKEIKQLKWKDKKIYYTSHLLNSEYFVLGRGVDNPGSEPMQPIAIEDSLNNPKTSLKIKRRLKKIDDEVMAEYKRDLVNYENVNESKQPLKSFKDIRLVAPFDDYRRQALARAEIKLAERIASDKEVRKIVFFQIKKLKMLEESEQERNEEREARIIDGQRRIG